MDADKSINNDPTSGVMGVEELFEWRHKLNVNQADVAAVAGCAQKTISRLENYLDRETVATRMKVQRALLKFQAAKDHIVSFAADTGLDATEAYPWIAVRTKRQWLATGIAQHKNNKG